MSTSRDSETTYSTGADIYSNTVSLSYSTETAEKEEMVVKIGIVGDQEVGKSSFMRRYVCQSFQHSSYGYYNNSPGSVLFLEKQISMNKLDLFLGLWCSTTYNTYESALQLVCNDANVIIFMFSLTSKQSLVSIKSWYDKALAQNPQFIPILVGTKYDIVHDNINSNNPLSHQYLNEYHKITKMARKYAMKMKASLIYTSSKVDININHVIKVCVAKVFNIRAKLREYHWNTLKALREHNIYKFLKIWSNKHKMQYLIHGYLKQQYAETGIKPNIMSVLINYLQYDLLPHHHHNEGRRKSSKRKTHRKKSSKITKSEKKSRRKSSKISTKSHKSSKKKKKSSKKRRKSSRIMKTKRRMPVSPVSTIHEYESYHNMMIEGAK